MHKDIFSGSSQCLSYSGGNQKLMEGFNSSLVSESSALFSSYKLQSNSILDLSQNYDFSALTVPLESSKNIVDAFLSYTPWSASGEETQPSGHPQVKTKIQAERCENGSESDLYGLVSNILEEPDQTQPCFAEGACSSILKSLWPVNTNRLPYQQDLLPETKRQTEPSITYQNRCITDSIPCHGMQKLEDTCHGLSGVGQTQLFPSRTDNAGYYSDNSNMALQQYCFPPSFESTGYLKDYPQKGTDLYNSYNRHCNDGDISQYDMLNSVACKQTNTSKYGIQDAKESLNGSSELFTTDSIYSRIFQAKQGYQTKTDDFTTTKQNYKCTKDPQEHPANPIAKDMFVPDCRLEPDFTLKTLALDGGSSYFANNVHKMQSKHNAHNFTSLASASSVDADSVRFPWMKRNCMSNQGTMMRTDSHSAIIQKKRAQNNVCSPSFTPNTASVFQKYSQEHTPTFGCSCCTTDRNQKDKREESLYNLVPGKEFKLLNRLHENSSYPYGVFDIGKQGFQMKPHSTQCDELEKNLENITQHLEVLLDNSVKFKNKKKSTGNKKAVNINKCNPLQVKCFYDPLMRSGDTQTSVIHPMPFTNMRSYFPHPLDHSVLPFIDCCESHPFEDIKRLNPRFNDLIYGEPQYSTLSPMFGIRESLRPRNVSSNELHVCLDKCYEQWREMQKERKQAEFILAANYTGKEVSSTNNTAIPRLCANPSRVDRLIVDQLREHARVVTLLGKMERLRSSPLHANISTALDRQLEAIHITQVRRKEEINNASNRQCQGESRCQEERDVIALASSVKNLSAATRKSRTALWCALQMTLPKTVYASKVDPKKAVPNTANHQEEE
uniref:Meiosis-specific coiled-coil domain-containing protein MEIOC-like n=1 Tax=Xenopus tropicalis TaxID=8364 RepID=A0A803K5L9_XENTR